MIVPVAMAKEIERKFLVRNDGWRGHAIDKSHFQQGYIVSMDDRSVRIRLIDENLARLTIKIGKHLLVRDEFEYDIPISDAKELLTMATGIVIQKIRYRIPHHGFVWEIDVFSGHYEGLIVAEVEMKSETDRPDLPEWLGREVTGDRRYSNQYLATEFEREKYGLSSPA